MKLMFLFLLKKPFFFFIKQESRSNLCNAKTSTQQILYQLYNAISVTELKGYAMMQFSWMLLKTYDKGN